MGKYDLGVFEFGVIAVLCCSVVGLALIAGCDKAQVKPMAGPVSPVVKCDCKPCKCCKACPGEK